MLMALDETNWRLAGLTMTRPSCSVRVPKPGPNMCSRGDCDNRCFFIWRPHTPDLLRSSKLKSMIIYFAASRGNPRCCWSTGKRSRLRPEGEWVLTPRCCGRRPQSNHDQRTLEPPRAKPVKTNRARRASFDAEGGDSKWRYSSHRCRAGRRLRSMPARSRCPCDQRRAGGPADPQPAWINFSTRKNSGLPNFGFTQFHPSQRLG